MRNPQTFRQLGFAVVAAACLTPWISMPQALLIGIGVGLLVGNPWPGQTRNLSKWLLQACVVLLGFNLNLATLARIGGCGLLLGGLTIAITLSAGWLLGRLLRLRGATATLLSAGTAICGGSAIAAVGSVIEAEPADFSVSLGAVFLLNAAALYLFPMIGHALGLTADQFGTWAGIGIHDVSSVVGAATRFDAASLTTATAVKLSRALWIIPLTLGISLARRRTLPMTANAEFGFARPTNDRARIQIPYFIGGFVIASLLRTMLPAVAAQAPALSHAATIGLTFTLFLIGAAITRQTLAAVGGKALLHATLLWMLIGSVGLVLARI